MESPGYESDCTLIAADYEAQQAPEPFPIFQLSIIWLIQFTEPLASSVIYPFLIPLVRESGISSGDERKIGYYAGAIESAYFFSECLSVYHWGKLSDRVGRRPVLLLGPLGIAFAVFSFGLSSNFWILIASRCVQGVFNGNIGVGKSMIVEITDPSDLPKAFGWIPAVWCAGITLGPAIGGALASPASKWPDSFGKFGPFVRHPYLLPCGTAGSIAFASYLYAYRYLRESTPSASPRDARKKCLYKLDSTAPLLGNTESSATYGNMEEARGGFRSGDESADCKRPPLRVLIRYLLVPLVNYGFVAFLDQSYQVLMPLMFSTSIQLGGLGFDPMTIGMVMGGWGVLNAVFQVVAFARMMRWVGPRKMYIVSFSCFVFAFVGFPVMNMFAKRAGGVDCNVVVVLLLQMGFFSVVYMSYGCAQILLINAAPSRTSLGAVNGIGQMVSTMMRALAPAVASSLFSISLERQLVGGYLVYVFLVGVTVVGVLVSFRIPSCVQEGKY